MIDNWVPPVQRDTPGRSRNRRHDRRLRDRPSRAMSHPRTILGGSAIADRPQTRTSDRAREGARGSLAGLVVSTRVAVAESRRNWTVILIVLRSSSSASFLADYAVALFGRPAPQLEPCLGHVCAYLRSAICLVSLAVPACAAIGVTCASR